MFPVFGMSFFIDYLFSFFQGFVKMGLKNSYFHVECFKQVHASLVESADK